MNQLSEDPVLRQLARLTAVPPDETHSAAVRARCHAALARQQRPSAGSETRPVRRRFLELAGAGAFAMVYVLFVINDALAMYGVFASPR